MIHSSLPFPSDCWALNRRALLNTAPTETKHEIWLRSYVPVACCLLLPPASPVTPCLCLHGLHPPSAFWAPFLFHIMLDLPSPPPNNPSNHDEIVRSPGLTSLYSLHPLHGSMAAPLSPSGVVTETTPLIASTYSTVGEYLETRAQHMLQQAARNELVLNDPEDVDLTHEFASALYALHIVERHDRARGSARAAAYRASETARVRADLKDYAVCCLNMAMAYMGSGDEDKDDNDDDVLVVTRPLALKPGKATNGESDWTTE